MKHICPVFRPRYVHFNVPNPRRGQHSGRDMWAHSMEEGKTGEHLVAMSFLKEWFDILGNY